MSKKFFLLEKNCSDLSKKKKREKKITFDHRVVYFKFKLFSFWKKNKIFLLS